MAIFPLEAKLCFPLFGLGLGLSLGLGLGLGLEFGLGLGLGLFWLLRQHAVRAILPPNGKITWGYFASRGKIATALKMFSQNYRVSLNFFVM